MSPLAVEMKMISKWCHPETGRERVYGDGVEYHFKKGMSLCWPGLKFHRWLEDYIHEYLNNRLIGLMGPASCGKSHDAAITGLFDYYCFPHETTCVYCSTTRELLRQRIWGEVVGLHHRAKRTHEWLPGHMIESRDRIVTSAIHSESEGRDFRNGLIGLAAKKGDSWVSQENFVGIKNKRLRFFIDECSLMNKAIVDCIANLDKNPDFKMSPLANPKDIADAFGILCEPSSEHGGWEGGIDQQPTSKVWKTKRPGGVCLQRIGTESPNLDGKLGIPLLTQEAIDRDLAFYGRQSVHFTMMDIGVMPRGQGSRRVLTRQDCDQHGARLMPFWANSSRTQIAHLDAAYGGVGGDRCRLMFSEFGEELTPLDDSPTRIVEALVNQPDDRNSRRQIFNLKETINVPIANDPTRSAPDQIATFCMEECVRRGIPPHNFIFDAGMRTALVQAFSRIWSVNVNSIDSMGNASSDRYVSEDREVLCKDYYKNLVTEYWWSVRLVVMAGQMRGMSEECIDDFSSREWGIVGNNKTQVEPKEDMKKKVGRSPDDGDCLTYGVELARRKGFKIRRLQPAVEPEEDEAWKAKVRNIGRNYWSAGSMVRAGGLTTR